MCHHWSYAEMQLPNGIQEEAQKAQHNQDGKGWLGDPISHSEYSKSDLRIIANLVRNKLINPGLGNYDYDDNDDNNDNGKTYFASVFFLPKQLSQ